MQNFLKKLFKAPRLPKYYKGVAEETMSRYNRTATTRVINKIAFMVHEPTMYAHYSSVWAEMELEAFVIVLLGPIAHLGDKADVHASEFVDKVKHLGYEVVYLDDVVRKGVKYRYVVSNHIMGGDSTQPMPFMSTSEVLRYAKNQIVHLLNLARRAVGMPRKYAYEIDPHQYFPLQAGLKQIRFMYGADISDAWSLDGWNEIYDLFLCHGPNDEAELNKRFQGRTAIMGYPRYDAYFASDLNVSEVVAEFGIDPLKKTVLWMPTFDAFKDDVCSIPHFSNQLAQLKSSFNLIVRPHPISFRLDIEGIQLLESLGFNIDRDAMRDMNMLFKVADTVLCDHGGSAFGALYLGKKLVFLQTPTKGSATVLKESSNLELMRYFPVIKPSEVHQLPALTSDQAYWQSKLNDSRILSDRYFADYRGTSAKKTADILRGLDSIFA